MTLYFMITLNLETCIGTATIPIVVTSVLNDLISVSPLISIVTSVKSRGSMKTGCYAPFSLNSYLLCVSFQCT